MFKVNRNKLKNEDLSFFPFIFVSSLLTIYATVSFKHNTWCLRWKVRKKRLMSEMENAFKQEKQPTSKKENSKNRKELWQSRWSGPTDIDWRTYVRLQFFILTSTHSVMFLHCFYDQLTKRPATDSTMDIHHWMGSLQACHHWPRHVWGS